MQTYVSLDPQWRKGWEQALGRPLDDLLTRSAQVAPHLAALAEDGRTLARLPGL